MTEKHLIWDLPLRIFHWSFAFTVLACWYTSKQGEELVDIHMQFGFVVLALLIFRILWGFIGPKHARFSQFIPIPKVLLAYIKKPSHRQKIPGHNPLGALMVILMIVLISLQAISGLFINDDVFSSGPYYNSVSKDIQDWMAFIHHNTFDFMIAAIILHIAAIIFYWRVKKDNLVVPMITGKKTTEQVKPSDAIPHSKLILGSVIALCCAAFVYWLVVINAPVIESFYY